jgi:CheY-like chemotaxis protein
MLITDELLPNPQLLKDVQILIVENNLDSRDLYALLLESYGAKVTKLSSIKDALELLNSFIPTLLICEMRFLGESVYPLIQKIRDLAFSKGRMIPILVTSTCPPMNLVHELMVNVEAYLLKPFELEHFVRQVWKLILLSRITYPFSIQAGVCDALVG